MVLKLPPSGVAGTAADGDGRVGADVDVGESATMAKRRTKPIHG